MKIIVTAGGTTEKIDQVRKITNSATGKLGSLTAMEFVKQCGDKVKKIYYICETGTIIPKLPCVEVITVKGVESVKNALTEIISSNKIDAVVHSMAVSDYTVKNMTTAESLASTIAHKLYSCNRQKFDSEHSLAKAITTYINENDMVLDNSNKVSSSIENLILTMKKTPKLIGMIKSLNPDIVLVGFKLLNGVEKQQLLEIGYDLLIKNNCDFVLANDLCQITDERHVGFLISPDKSYIQLENKEKIAEEIVGKVLSKLYDKESHS